MPCPKMWAAPAVLSALAVDAPAADTLDVAGVVVPQ